MAKKKHKESAEMSDGSMHEPLTSELIETQEPEKVHIVIESDYDKHSKFSKFKGEKIIHGNK